jgi:UDP-2-acetamido-3-amino-2,3-dideoxy-glucuronate N-acetyltransferase
MGDPRGRVKREYFVHAKGLVDEGARIGRDTRVWAFAHVLPGATVGQRCNICDHAYIETGATLGDDVTVKTSVSVWEGVTVENGVFLGPSCVFTNDRVPRSLIKRPKAAWLVPTLLKEGCTIGANATIICGNTVGRFAFVAAGAVVTSDVPDHAVVAGVPAKQRGWICKCGGTLTAATKQTCAACGQAYVRAKSRMMPLEGPDK